MASCCFCNKDTLRCLCKKTAAPMGRTGREMISACEVQLRMMGFDPAMARRAAELSGGNAEDASELILSHTDLRRPNSPPRSSASSPSSKPSAMRTASITSTAFPPRLPARTSSQSLPLSNPTAASRPSAVSAGSSAYSSSSSSPRSAAVPPPVPPHPPAAMSPPSVLPPYNPSYTGIAAPPTLPRVSLLSQPSYSTQPLLSQPSLASTAQLPSSSFVSMSDSPSSRHAEMVTASASALSSPSHSSSYQKAQQISDLSSSSSSSSSYNSQSLPSDGFAAPDVVSRLSPAGDDAMDSENEVSIMSWQGDVDEDDEELQPGAAAATSAAVQPEQLQLRGVVIHVDGEQQAAVLEKIRQDDEELAAAEAEEAAAAAAAAAVAMSPLPPLERPVSSPPARNVSAPASSVSSPSSHASSAGSSRTSSASSSPYNYLPVPLSASQSSAQFDALAAWLNPEQFRPQMQVDCQDAMGKWLSARLLRLHSDYSASSAASFCSCKVHYDGWDSRWDEDIDLLQQPQRICRAGLRSQPPPGFLNPLWARTGSRVVAWLPRQGRPAGRSSGQWCEGRIQKVELHQALVACVVVGGSERDGRKAGKSSRWYQLDGDCLLSLDELERMEEQERAARRADERAQAAAFEQSKRARDEQRRHRSLDDQLQRYRKEMEQQAAKAQHAARRSGSTPRYADPLASTAGLPSLAFSPYAQVKRETPAARTMPPLSSLGSISLRSTSTLSSSSSSSSSPTAVSALVHLKKATSAPPLPGSTSPPSSSSSFPSSSSAPTWWQGQFLEAKDTADRLPAEVLQVDSVSQSLLVHYEGWSSRWDEWISFSSSRLRPLGSTLRDSREERQRKRHERLFRVLLASLPFELETESKDGNCLFRAFAHQLWGDSSLHGRARAQCCDYIEREGQYYGKFVTDDEGVAGYVRRKRRGEEWGDHVEIEAMKELYDVNVVVYTQAWKERPGRTKGAAAVKAEGERKEAAAGGGEAEDREADDEESGEMVLDVKGEELGGVRGTVRLSYHGRNHYNSLLDAAHPPPLLRRGEEGRGDGQWKQARLEAERKEQQMQAAMEARAASKTDSLKEAEEMKDGYSSSRPARDGDGGGAGGLEASGASMSLSAAKVLHEKQLILMGNAPYAN